MSMRVLPSCPDVYCVCAWYPRRPDEGVRVPVTGVTEGCEELYGFGELNSGPLEEKSVLSVGELFLSSSLDDSNIPCVHMMPTYFGKMYRLWL